MIVEKYSRPAYLLGSIVKNFSKCEENINWFIAGGAVRSVFANESIKDVDIFFYTINDYKKFIKHIKINDRKLDSPDFCSLLADSFKINGIDYQLIKKIYGSESNVIKQFDFSVCTCAYDPRKSEFYLHDKFFENLSTRTLVFDINAKYPISSLYRVKKYLQKGYQLPAVELIKIALSINNLNMSSYKDLRDQLEGIDTLFLKSVTDAFLDKEDDGYDFANAIEFIEKVLNEKYEMYIN
jgi:hypothetical protein